ncbi:type II toxin-antitoxin system Phd/YefM family antitoxin [Rhizobium bangladeshense]|uniref:type II toxin-antitoxin system Phd/YefM family antitoxin n=1 Tax=Rhizobium bangladeshense TaxID=1138189 RepID=UPI001C83F858|nr:type II toxin-antitoxin system Phd/YefM family antitoxin [Rhizobium bangladeshense]MBX4870198.1 type II toxin-antitoxin system Phd/YefM family antitoxin [Rhizobium bangladeshense]
MRQFTTGDLNKQVGDVTDVASREPVVLTRHNKPRFVLMSYEHYERMRTSGDPRRVYHISEMPDEHVALFDETLDQLARGEGYDDEPEIPSRRGHLLSVPLGLAA